MFRRILLIILFLSCHVNSATIAIIDTGFDIDHDYLKPKILKNETDEEGIQLLGQNFFDNSHLKRPVIEDRSSLQEVLLYRSLKAKGHKEGMSMSEFEWFTRKSTDKEFMEKVKLFKKHSHGTFVAGIALREGENISIFPIRGLNIPTPVVAVGDASSDFVSPLKGKTPEEKFLDEINQSVKRITRKFSKIVRYVSHKKIEVINASYGITYKSIMTKFRDRYKEMTGKEIEETQLKVLVDEYFRKLYEHGEKTMRKHSQILFVFSAGNSGIDNDLYHHYPSRIRVPNSISVAAMNGDYLATFSNFGKNHVDVGAPGVGILSLLPKVYQEGAEIYSPSSGTSMAAPYVANLAAQVLNANPRLSPPEIKRIILESGDVKVHLTERLASGSVVNNQKAIRTALLSKDFPLDEAINLGRFDLIPMDKISTGIAPAVTPDSLQKKVLDSIPSVITPAEIDEEPTVEIVPTKSESSLQKDQAKERQDNSTPPASIVPDAPEKSSDPVPSSPIEEQSQTLSEETPAFSSPPQLIPPATQSEETSPSLPKL